MTPQSITSELQKLAPSAIIELFELDLTPFGDTIYRFHAGTNGLTQNIIWQGNEYVRFPIEAEGFEISGNSQLPRPRLRAANLTGAISLLALTYGDLIGAKVTRKRTMAKYLDGANFPDGINPDADPNADFADDVFFIDRKANENRDVVDFELSASFDVAGVKLPRRQIIQNVCYWKYRGEECGYAGNNFFNTNDQPVGSLALDACGKRLESCKLRFGQNAELPFGGFPAAGLIR